MRGIRLARIAGVDVHVDWSLTIIFVLITVSLAAGLFPVWHPDWSRALTWTTALAAAVLFFASVLAHELSHALVGRAQGMRIRRITLFIFGGMAHLEHEPDRWRAELAMAIVGPITSLVIGGVCLALSAALASAPVATAPASVEEARAILAQLGPAATLLLWLGQINIVLAIFNLVPGFPLDGGRVLRAALWGFTGDLKRATRWASLFGQAFAWLLIGSGIAMLLGLTVPVFGSGPVSGIWLAFIGWFLNNAALMSYRQLLTREALEDVPASRLMVTRFASVAPDTTVEALVEEHALASGQSAFPVVDSGRLLGIVSLRDLEKVQRARRMELTARDVMTSRERLGAVGPDDDALEVLDVLARRDVRQVPVLEGERVVGLVRREDVLRWLALHGQPASRSG